MIPRNLIVAAAVAGVAGGAWTVWKTFRTPLEKKPTTVRHLPGFSITVPEDSKQGAYNDEYGGGKLELGAIGGTNASLFIGWQFGEMPDAASMLEIGRVTAKGAGTDPSAVHLAAGANGRTLALDTKGRLFMTITPCGQRLIMSVTEGAGAVAHQTFVDSIACTPDPDKESSTLTLPIAIDLPGFQTTQHLPGQIVVETPTARVAMRRQMSNEMLDVLTDKLAKDFLKAVGIDGILGPRHGDILTFTAKWGEAVEPGLIRFIKCGTWATLVVVSAADMATMNEVEPRIAAAHCLAPGEAAPTWPEAEQPAEAAEPAGAAEPAAQP